MTLIDAGPLVALFDAGDKHHARCRDAFRSLRPPVGTVWPAVTEAMHLLDFSAAAQSSLWDFIDSAPIEILPLDASDVPRMRELMQKYGDLPMDIADAAVVCVAERERITRVFTLDRRDFGVYRLPRGKKFTIIP